MLKDFVKNIRCKMKKIVIIIVSLLVVFIGVCVVSTQLTSSKAPNCENKIVKSEVGNIFMEGSPFIQNNLDTSSIADVNLINPRVEHYDNEADKYYCQGTIVVTSNENGFKLLQGKSMFYLSFFSGRDYDVYTRYECDVEYTSQLSEQRPYITSSYCYYDSKNARLYK